MRTFMTLMCLPFTTIFFGIAIQDFHYSLITIVLATFIIYLFWEKWFEVIKKDR